MAQMLQIPPVRLVGAGKCADCRHNSGLACHTPRIQVGQAPDGVDFMTSRAH